MASVKATSGAEQEHALVRARRDDELLEDELDEIGKALQQPEGPTTLGPRRI
jgi:hypothetical protein